MTLEQKLSPSEQEYLKRHAQLVEQAGGRVADTFFVIKPGCMVLAETQTSPEAAKLFAACNLDSEAPLTTQLVEFNARITYLSFKKEASDASDFHDKMARQLAHLSIWGGISVTFLLAGIAAETSMELLAHSEARSARLTTSKTKAMNAPLYRLLGGPADQEYQRSYLLRVMEERLANANYGRSISEDGNEFFNILAPGSKATSLTYTMNLKDYHKLFIGRLSEHGNEAEVQEICRLMCEQLHARYPIVIRTVEEYYAMNNSEKYRQ